MTDVISKVLIILSLHVVSGQVIEEISGRNSEDYRTNLFRAYPDHSLEGSVLAAAQASSPIDCAALCTSRGPECKSYNYAHAHRLCEINSGNKTENAEMFVIKKGFTHYEEEPVKSPAEYIANFTTLGAGGRTGPTSFGDHYKGQSHADHVTLVSGIQHWTVPHSGAYRIEAVGASGGYDTTDNAKAYRGRGAKMAGTFTLNKGDIIKILVGQEGGINSVAKSTGGGGGSFVVKGDTPLLVAGGGGGTESPLSRHAPCDASKTTSGNSGYGGLAWPGGTGGNGATTADSDNSGGGGGGYLTGGRSSTVFGGEYGTGGEGGKAFVNGGVGGRSYTNSIVGGFGGGGGAYGNGGGAAGGGGYSGGASGDNNYDSCGGGGGSYNAGSDKQEECCYNEAGHGHVSVYLISIFG
ncbi:PE-PGRS family protein PE_PGRS30 [Nematostella vectensis]|uniref:PE-PGRS family protein PE_PGRS30 n=1 Tax=Nematostella vectensis TaxID=45351 RepID=UPI0020771259|nr:PE-PGRS family protein PE_PGRS30 [Nematostella vectensis]XP_048576687.1 PE-PGRS family protein PE_PGRS30 [Nematostella vectensis]